MIYNTIEKQVFIRIYFSFPFYTFRVQTRIEDLCLKNNKTSKHENNFTNLFYNDVAC